MKIKTTHRVLISCWGWFASTWALVLLLASPASAQTVPTRPPNFVVILMDDMGYGDIGAFGSKLNRTPELDRMAAEGMRLTSFYAASVCTPSRAQLLTGCYATRVSMPDVVYPASHTGLSTSEKTVAALLKERGYATACIGKWHLGDQPQFLPPRHGFDQYFGLPYSNDMGGELVSGSAAKGKRARPPLPLMRGGEVIEAPVDQDGLTKRYTEEAVKFITENKDRPFFLYFPQTAVHVPLHPGSDFKGKSANGMYGDWVEEVDWSVGRVMEALRANKLDANTLVLFTSDNGPWLVRSAQGGIAGPLRGGKGTTWEGGVRVPTLAWWPGKIAAGSTCDATASELDVMPTLVKLAGGSVPSDRVIDGRDIWPLLSGVSQQSPHEALFHFNSIRLEAVRSGAWKLVIAPQGDGKKGGVTTDASLEKPRLYNLDADIGEQHDVAAEHPDVVQKLKEYVATMDADLGIGGKGPGVRPCGRDNSPKPLLKRSGIEYD